MLEGCLGSSTPQFYAFLICYMAEKFQISQIVSLNLLNN